MHTWQQTLLKNRGVKIVFEKHGTGFFHCLAHLSCDKLVIDSSTLYHNRYEEFIVTIPVVLRLILSPYLILDIILKDFKELNVSFLNLISIGEGVPKHEQTPILTLEMGSGVFFDPREMKRVIIF